MHTMESSVIPSPFVIFVVWVAFTSGIFVTTSNNFVQGASDSSEIMVLKDSDLDTTPLPPAPEFVVYEGDYLPCVRVKMDATIVIEPKRVGAAKKPPVTIPKSADVTGDCGKGEDSKMILSWNSFRFTWHFQKSRVSDAWYIDEIELSYNTSDKSFDTDSKALPGAVQVVRSDDPLTLYLTPVGRSYMCNLPKSIKLSDQKLAKATVTLNRVHIQPFAGMTHWQYGNPFKCPEEAGRRDESVPLFVGLLLAVVVLATIGGYAGYRYFRVKKIEYDTME